MMGFCIFNNVAAAARAALRHWGAKRVAIFDWSPPLYPSLSLSIYIRGGLVPP